MERKSSGSVKVFYPKFDTPALVKALRERVGKLNQVLPTKLVVLFGSYARGNYTVASDIDLLVLYKGETRGDAYAKVKGAFDIPQLEPHVYSEAEYRKLERTIERMRRDGKVIYKERTVQKP